MEIKIAENSTAWDAWLVENGGSFSVLQSSSWATAIKNIGRTVEMLQVIDRGGVVAEALVDYRPAGFGKFYAFCPKGPVIAKNYELRIKSHEFYDKILSAITGYFKNKNVVFLRIEPSFIIHNSLSIIHPVKDINPPATLLLDLTPTPEDLLANMHPKTRYNIRLAEKKGVRIEVKKSLEILWDLLQKTGARDNFGIHPKKTYEEVLKLPNVEQLIAYVNDIPVATGCFIRFGNVVSYLYGASDHTYRESMAPHLVQWTAIQRAREQDATTYDFFGISPSKKPIANNSKPLGHDYDERHRYAGVTRFKLGFGGVVHEDPGTFDIVLSPNNYFFFSLFRYFRSVFHL